jgi:cytosine deaminase
MTLPPLLLRGGRVLRTGSTRPELIDVMVDSAGRIARLGRVTSPPADTKVIDLDGRLVSSGFVDVHQHLDKTRTHREVANPSGTLFGAIEAFNVYAATISENDLIRRAERTLTTCLSHGTIAVRTHANVDTVMQTRGVEILIKLRERWRDRIRLQVVAFLTGGAVRIGAAARPMLDDAIAGGADVVGGAPANSDTPDMHLDMLFDAAGKSDLPLDLHLDEHLDAGRQLFDAVIKRTKAYNMQGRVAVGHCSALSAMQPDAARRVIDGFAQAGISVITLPSANLFLQGRDAGSLTPRGLTRVRELVAAGVRVAAGSDNIQDPFVPVGSGNMLETARWAFLAGHLGTGDLGQAYTMVTRAPADIMGFGADYGVHENALADLIVTDGEDAEDLVASGPPVRHVFLAGRPVAGTL